MVNNSQDRRWFKHQGVTFDNRLDFSVHIDKSVSHKTLEYILRAGKDFNNPNTVVTLFNVVVRPKLEYGSVVWSPYTFQQISKLERVQGTLC